MERQNRPAVAFTLNTPVEVALKYADGKMVQGVFGDRMMFTTTKNEVMFLDCDVAAKINMLEVQPGEPFMICKQKYKQGTIWKVWREQPGQPPTIAGESGLERDLRHSLVMQRNSPHGVLVVDKPKDSAAPPAAAQGAKLPPIKPPAATQVSAPPPAPQPMPHANGNGKLPPIKPTYEEAMAQFLLAAGRVSRETEVKLGAEGGSVRFDSRDVAALATTFFIQAAKEGLLQYRPGPGK